MCNHRINISDPRREHDPASSSGQVRRWLSSGNAGRDRLGHTRQVQSWWAAASWRHLLEFSIGKVPSRSPDWAAAAIGQLRSGADPRAPAARSFRKENRLLIATLNLPWHLRGKLWMATGTGWLAHPRLAAPGGVSRHEGGRMASGRGKWRDWALGPGAKKSRRAVGRKKCRSNCIIWRRRPPS